VPAPRTPTSARWLPWVALATVVLSIAVGAWHHWTLSLPVVGALRLLDWLLRGVYASVPLLLIGAVIVGRVDRGALRLPLVLAIATTAAVGATAVILVGIALLSLGLYTPIVWQLSALALWLAGTVWLATARWRPFLDLWARTRDWGRRRPLPGWWAFLLIVVLAITALHASLPPDTRDELSYHLVVPRMWALQGDWWLPTDNFHALFPGNCELLWGWADAVGGPLAPRFLTLAFALLTVGVLAQWLGETVADRWARGASLVFLTVTPALLTAAVICYVEWPMLLLLILGWRLSRIPGGSAGPPHPVWPAALWGAAAGMKYTAFVFVGLLGLDWALSLLRSRLTRRAITSAALVTIGVAVLALPWLARNLIATGDPIYPLGAAIAPAGETAHDPSDLADYAGLKGPWRWVPWLYHATADSIADHRLHPLWPLLHVIVLAVGWRWFRDLPWLPVAGGTLAFAWFNPAPRVYAPLLILVWLFLPRLLATAPPRSAARLAAGMAIGIVMFVSVPVALYYLFVPGGSAVPSYLIGLTDRAGFLAARGVTTPSISWVAQQSAPDARVWAWCEDRTLYLERWARADSPYGPPSFLLAAARGGAAAFDQEVRRWDIDLVVLRRDRCPESFTGYRFEKRTGSIDPPLRATIAVWAAEHLRERHRDDRNVVYDVVR
jgi:hypothetical protein